MSNGESNSNGNGKWSFERILLVIALGGNIGLGGAMGLSGEDPQHPQHSPIPHVETQVPLSETCDFKLAMCQWELKELEEDVQELKSTK